MEDHTLTAPQYPENGPKLDGLRTVEDVRRCIAERATLDALLHASVVRRRQAFRRGAMLVGLFCSAIQYYFFTMGLEIMSMPSLTVFLPVARLG